MLRGIKAPLILGLALLSSAASACQTCRPQWQAGVYNADFGRTLGTLFVPLAVLGAIAYGIYKSDQGADDGR
jgi:hypothetical protein